MLTFDFKKCFFGFFKPLNNLFSNFFDFQLGIFAANSAFPDKAYTPAFVLIIFEVFFIAFFILGKLLFPEFLVRFWENKVLAVFMSVPEAAVYEDYSKISRENKVWFARIPFVAYSIAKTSLKKGRTDLFFRFRIL